MLRPGQEIPLAIEKPAAGGRMIARFDGQVVLVAGAIPGESVVARVERVERRLAFATVARVAEASPSRRTPVDDPLCGGCVYSHIAYDRQLALKADVIGDAFARVGRMPLATSVAVAASPEHGYRMRARLHAAGGRVGFYREGTHSLCDAGPGGQLTPESLEVVRSFVAGLAAAGAQVTSVELAENIPSDQRALSIELDGSPRLSEQTLIELVGGHRLTGCVVRDGSGTSLEAGTPVVADGLATLTGGRANKGEVQRRAESFFQGNRFLVPELVAAVVETVGSEGTILDLYAGVGLFSAALCAMDRGTIVAVEGDRFAGPDLERNAAQFPGALLPMLDSVERYLRRAKAGSAATVIVDPPRTGVSPEALESIVRLGAQRLVYVSCDPATMARDVRRLVDGGYRLESLRAFDLFPNTAHIETVGILERT